jgi:hypothetical protein
MSGPDLSKPIPIEAFFGVNGTDRNCDWDVLGTLDMSQLIVGIDIMTGHEFLLYGRQVLDSIEKTGVKIPLRVLKIELDQDSQELEKATALVHLTKGRCDYDGFVNE